MRLLHRSGNDLSFSAIRDDQPKPRYAILSHTWGPEQEEVSYDDVLNNRAADKVSYQKLEFCLEQAHVDGLEHIWIDTCCINKVDKSETHEAINKMFSWYKNAEVCYVYLADVSQDDWNASFVKSRWHTRGWTLQELVAPRTVRFYGKDRKYIGDKASLHFEILQATTIDVRKPLSDFTIPQRYGWSFTRKTTKSEDLIYCMVGIMGVSLIFNYGENASDPSFARERLLDQIEVQHGRPTAIEIRRVQTIRDAPPSTLSPSPSVAQESITRLLDALKFKNMNARRETISTPYRETCNWLLENENCKRWVARDSHLLWIKGKPGAGKSTLIKYAQMQTSGTHIDFYFNARGDELERSTYGMYRSLLYQLLEKIPLLQHAVMAHISEYRKLRGQPWVPSIDTVKEALAYLIGRLDRPILCFVDALDECPASEAQETVNFFERIHHKALNICFSSRYYPAIRIKGSAEIDLECREQELALEKYVDGHLNETTEDYPEDAMLRAQVIAKANGIFFWLVLVVRFLVEELENGRTYNLQRKLEEMPAGLSELLNNIVNGHGDRVALCLSLQWILFSRRPLSREEYYSAVLTSLSEAGVAPADVWRQYTGVKSKSMDKFVTSSSRGLAYVTKGTATVQFIHESVKDFFVTHGGLKNLYGPGQELESARHDALKTVCYKHVTIAKASSPLWTYARQHMFHHAEQAAAYIPQDDFLEEVDFRQWWDLFDFQELSVYRKWVDDSDKELCILAAANAPRLIRTAGLRARTMHASPLLVSVMRRNIDTLTALLDCGANINAVDAQGATALLLSLWNEYFDLQICKLLLQRDADPNVRDYRGRTPLILATQNNRPEIVELLLNSHADKEAKSSNDSSLQEAVEVAADSKYRGKTALTIAIEAGFDFIMTMLLDRGAKLEAKDDNGNTALLTACKKLDRQIICKEPGSTLIQNLLAYGPDLEARDNNDRTALMIVSGFRRSDVVSILLAAGADVHAQDKFGISSLHLACTPGSTDTAVLLLDAGAHPSSLFLKVCGEYNSAGFVKVLLKHGAEIESRDESGRTALMIACWWSRLDTVIALLDNHASLDAVDSNGRTALDWSERDMSAAKVSYDPAIRQLLLDRSGRSDESTEQPSRPIPAMTIDTEDGGRKRLRLATPED